jgi:hypothetical protein
MKSKDTNSRQDTVQQFSGIKEFHLTAEFQKPTGTQIERFDYIFGIYSTWLARAVVQRAGLESNTSPPADHSSQPVLTSHLNNCTVGTPRYCNTGDSDK